MSDEEMATDRWENEGGHAQLSAVSEGAISASIAKHVAAAIAMRQSNGAAIAAAEPNLMTN